MSYCRVGPDSDVYVIRTMIRGEPAWDCISCALVPKDVTPRATLVDSPHAMFNHLLRHQETGHKVPESALERLSRESV